MILSSILLAAIYFVPVWSEISNETYSFGTVFFSSSNPEYTLGANEDMMGSIWIVGKMQEMLLGQTSTFLPDIFVPYGYDFGKATGFAWVDAILALPWVWLIGYPGFYNWHVFWTLFLNALLLMLFFQRLSKSTVLSIALASVALWNPFVAQELSAGRITQVHWHFLIGLIWFVWEMMQKEARYWHAIGAGVCLILACFVYWFSAIPVAFMLFLIYLKFAVEQDDKQVWFRGVLASTIGVLGILCVAFSVIIPMLKGDTSLYMAMDVQPQSDWFGLPIQRIDTFSLKTWRAGQIPMLVLILGTIGIWYTKSRRTWLCLWLIALTLPLGVAFHWQGWIFPTGYSLLHWAFPPLIRCQWPNRMMVAPLFFGLSIFAFVWHRVKFQQKVHQFLQYGIVVFIFVVVCFDAPVNKSLKVGQFKEIEELTLWGRQHPGGLIEVPYISSYDTYVQQIFHKQPILGGPGLHNVRPKPHLRYVERNQFLQGLERLSEGIDAPIEYTKRDLLALKKDGLKWVVVYPEQTTASIEQFIRYCNDDPKFVGQEIWIFLIP